MAVRIRMKKMGRTHRPFFRVCVMDQRSPRDGRVIEEVGYYDPMCPETDARTVLKTDRIDHWLSVGAQPSEKMKVLIKKYGTNGSHLEQQKAAMERLGNRKNYTPSAEPEAPAPKPEKPAEPAAEAPAESETAPAAEAAAESGGEAAATEEAKTE